MASTTTEPPRSGSRTPTRTTRRSHPNLHQLNLSIAPLSSAYDPSHVGHADNPRSSYIAPRTAPTTPSILSRSASQHRNRNGRLHAHYDDNSYFRTPLSPDVGSGINITKAKSDAALPGPAALAAGPRHHAGKGTAALPLNGRKSGSGHITPKHHYHHHHTPADSSGDWLYRAGLAIASETRESKGQSWLGRRESSTSLVRQGSDNESDDDNGDALPSRSSSHVFADDEFSPATPRYGSSSHPASRAGSAFPSRRGSGVRSRTDLKNLGLTAREPRTPSAIEEDEYFGEQVGMEPDFVESDEEGVGDEEEIARLARERGFGLGGWVDRLIGWTLFSVEEDGEETDEEDAELHETIMTEEESAEAKKKREEEAKRRREERARLVEASRAENKELPKPQPEDAEGGWQDAAWLFSVASKVLL